MHINCSTLHRSVSMVILLPSLCAAASAPVAVRQMGALTVPQCSSISLHAAFLAEETPGQGTGFLLSLENRQQSPVEIPIPMPLSVDWYAKVGNQWSWRASSGAGGSLVNAFNGKGPLFAISGASYKAAWVLRRIAPHETYTWTVFAGSAPPLSYRPSCEHCNATTEAEYEAVLAYAFIAKAEDRSALSCGLRSNAIVMPPLAPEKRGPSRTR